MGFPYNENNETPDSRIKLTTWKPPYTFMNSSHYYKIGPFLWIIQRVFFL